MESLCVKFNIQKKGNYYNLKNIVENIIQSTNTISYMNKIQEKKKIDKCYYVSKDKFIELLKKGKKESCKTALQIINNNQIIPVKPKAIDNDFSFDINDYKYIVVDGEIWFKGKDIAAGMGYSDTKTAIIDHVNIEFKLPYENLRKKTGFSKGNTKKTKPNTIFINRKGIESLIIKARKPKSIEFAKLFNIDVCKKYPYKETEILHNIIDYLTEKNIDFELQESVGKYKLDMYLYQYFINIEIDEFGHKDRDPNYEKEREDFIKNELCCSVIRFDPDDKSDSIFKFLGRLDKLIQKNKKENDKLIKDLLKNNEHFKSVFRQKFFETFTPEKPFLIHDLTQKKIFKCDNNDLLIQKEITKQKELELKKENASLINSLVLNNRFNNLDEIVSKHSEINKKI